MNNRIIAFLPCREGSERVKEKNTRIFAGIEGGLIRIKLDQLVSCIEINEIVVSTDDAKVSKIAEEVAASADKQLQIIERPPHLARSDTSTDELINHVPDLIQQGIVLWTHVTSPFVDEKTYGHAILQFREKVRNGHCDSLMSVTTMQTFLWNRNGPVNYDRTIEKWPRTQTLPRWFEVNSAMFITPIDIYRTEQDRIGHAPFLYELGFPGSLDIDTEEDFYLAEQVWHYGKKK